jgi:hypothetical protein
MSVTGETIEQLSPHDVLVEKKTYDPHAKRVKLKWPGQPILKEKQKRIGPYSHTGAMARLDGRCKEAQFMKRRRAQLLAYVGARPSTIQRQLIERAVRLSLHVELMDARLINKSPGPYDRNVYLAWSNSLTRTLTLLGLMTAARRNKSGLPRFIRDLVGADLLDAEPAPPSSLPRGKREKGIADLLTDLGESAP